MFVSTRHPSAQLSLFAPQLAPPAPRINNTTPTAPSSTLNRTIPVCAPVDSRVDTLEARIRRSIAIMQARPQLKQAA